MASRQKKTTAASSQEIVDIFLKELDLRCWNKQGFEYIGRNLKKTKHDLKRAGVNLKPEPSIGASHQVSVHLAKQFQRRFLEITQPETKIAYGSHVC